MRQRLITIAIIGAVLALAWWQRDKIEWFMGRLADNPASTHPSAMPAR